MVMGQNLCYDSPHESLYTCTSVEELLVLGLIEEELSVLPTVQQEKSKMHLWV